MELALAVAFMLALAAAVAGWVAWGHERRFGRVNVKRIEHLEQREHDAMNVILLMRRQGYEGPALPEDDLESWTLNDEHELAVERWREESAEAATRGIPLPEFTDPNDGRIDLRIPE